MQVKKERQSRVASTLGRAASTLGRAEDDILPWDSHGQALISSRLFAGVAAI